MINPQIRINRRAVDFVSIEAAPFSLRRATDKFTSIIGADGTTIDNVAKSLVLPASKSVELALGPVHFPNYSVREMYDVCITISGVQVFNGKGVYQGTLMGCRYAKNHRIGLLGDGRSVWRQLEGINLTDLDLGRQSYDLQSVLDSFTGTYDTGWSGIFAPVVYGQTTGNAGLNTATAVFEGARCDFQLQDVNGVTHSTEDITIEWIVIDGERYDLNADLFDPIEYYANIAALPGTGDGNTLYVVNDDGTGNPDTFIWTGSAYVLADPVVTGTHSGIPTFAQDIFEQLTYLFSQNDLDYQFINVTYDDVTETLTVDVFGATFKLEEAKLVYFDGTILIPVGYPRTIDWVQTNCIDNQAFALEDILFHLYHRSILDAIFNKLLCYTIQSDFFNKEWFKEQVYISTGQNIEYFLEDFPPRVETASLGDRYDDGEFIIFANETTDVNGEMSGTTFTAASTQLFTFKLRTQVSTNDGDFKRIIALVNGNPVQVFVITANSPAQDEFEFTVPLSAGDTVQFQVDVYPTNGNIVGNVWLNVCDTTNIFFELQSLLHPKGIKDYLRGLSHKYCLAWFADAALCIMYVEPRFDYEINGVKCKGFYNRISSVQRACLDCQSYTIDQINPFGQYVELAFGADNGDYALAKAYDANTDDVIWHGVRVMLNDLNKAGTPSRNPYFFDLTLAQFDTIAASPLPVIFDDLDDNGNLQAINFSYENPKSALIHRGLATFYFEGAGEVTGPLLAQGIGILAPNGNPVYWDTLLTYSDTVLVDANGDVRAKGIVTTFYMQYLAVIRHGRLLKGRFNMDFVDVVGEDFRTLKDFEAQDCNFSQWILLEISGFQPTKQNLTEMQLLAWACMTIEEFAFYDHWELGFTEVEDDDGNGGVDCSGFSVNINVESSLQDCLYEMRFYHPTTNQENGVSVRSIDDEVGYVFEFRCIITKTCNGAVEELKNEISFETEFDTEFNIRTDLNVGGYLMSFRFYDSAANTVPIDIDISPTSPYLSGPFGTVLGADLVFNGTNIASIATNLEIVIQNAFAALGYSTSNYDLFVFDAFTDDITILLYAKHNPSGSWLGINENDGLVTYNFNGLTLNNPIVFSDKGQGVVSNSYITPCGLITRSLGFYDGDNYVGNMNWYFIPIINANDVLSPSFLDNNSITCQETVRTLTAVPSGCTDSPTYLWNTGENTQSIIADAPGTYEVTVTCGLCEVTQSVTVS